MKLYFDGAAKNNGRGPAGAGWSLEDGPFPNREGYKFLGRATNNEAEYQGLIEGLKDINPQVSNLKVYGDSKLVIEQMKGNWKVKAANLKPLWREATELAKQFSQIEFIWIKRDLNSKADAMANLAIEKDYNVSCIH
jgi:ribonuclease HI